MECRRPVITGGVLRSPPSASAAPLTVAANPNVMRHRGRRHSRLYDCGDNVVDEYNNNNSNVNAVTTINNTTQLIDELEQLRTDNFQLRLRVYNAERRVDRLSAAALDRDRKRRSDNTDTDSDDTDDSSGHAESGTDHNTAAAKATAEAAVRTIHDLLTVNRRLLALLAATVSAKAVSVSSDDKRRWQRLRNHIVEYAVDGPNEKKTNEDDDDNDDEFHDASPTDSETSCKARVVEGLATRQNVLRSPLPPPQPPPSRPLETTSVDDEGAGSEVSRLRGRCRRLERSLQQLVNTELWARNRQIGKLEQQRYVTQVADAAAQRDRRPIEQVVKAAVAAPSQQHHLQQFRSKAAESTASPPVTKGILVIRSATEIPNCSTAKTPTAACMESQIAAVSSPPKVATITTPPPVLPDYSEVNFFFSCDEEDDDDNHDRREDSTETNYTLSSEEETANSNAFRGDKEPVRLAAVGTPVTSSTSKRKRQCRPHHRQSQQPIKCLGDSATVTTTTSSSTESAAPEDEADKLNDGSVIMTTTTAASLCTTRRQRTVSGGSGLHRRRRCRPPRRCSTCGRCSGVVDAAASDRPRPPSVADAQVQCGDGNVAVDHSCNIDRGDGELQLQQLRRELDARRRENSRLYDMLLRLQRGTRPGDRGKGDGGPRIPSPDFSDSDPNGLPEPYQRAAGVVRGRIADLLPPLLSMRSISDDDDGEGGSHQRYRPDGAEQQQQQQQQQLQLLTRLRERIVAYERRELDGGDDRATAVVQQSADSSDDGVRRMNRTDLVNVALPRVVERLRQALVPLLQHRPENIVAAASTRGGSVNAGGDFVIDGARSPPPSGGL